MQIATQASLINRSTSFTPKAHGSSLGSVGKVCVGRALVFPPSRSGFERRAEEASPQYSDMWVDERHSYRYLQFKGAYY